MRVWIGYDAREHEAYEVCKFSLEKHESLVDARPLVQSQLRERGLYWRPEDGAATAFSLTRFLVPRLMDYQGWAVFVDCDFAFTRSVAELFALADDRYAAMVVKHYHEPQQDTKMDGCAQMAYPRKNWSSLVLWNCGHEKNRNLTPEVVNTVQPSFLHRFQWLDDQDVGGIPLTWNFLEGYYKPFPGGRVPAAIHWTHGGPWFEHMQDVDYAEVYTSLRDEMEATVSNSS